MQAQAMEMVEIAIKNSGEPDAADHIVNALRCVDSSTDATRRLAIQRIEDHIAAGDAPRSLVNLLISLRRADWGLR